MHPPRQIAILSDSLGALLVLRAGHTEYHTFSVTLLQLWKLTWRKFEFDFIWIPGRKRIGFKPDADQLAQEAASLPNDNQILFWRTVTSKLQYTLYVWSSQMRNTKHRRPEIITRGCFDRYMTLLTIRPCQDDTQLYFFVYNQLIAHWTPSYTELVNMKMVQTKSAWSAKQFNILFWYSPK